MFRKRLPKIHLKNLLAALLVITLSGAYCLFCCPEIKAAGQNEHCPISRAARADHCDPSGNNPAETSPAAASLNIFECCGLKFNFFIAKLEKNEVPQQAAVPGSGNFDFLETVRLVKRATARFSYRAPPLTTGRRLHLKNRVFRI